MPLPAVTSLSATPARRRLAVKCSRSKEAAIVIRVDQARPDKLLAERDLL
jgi:hypothetical protein